MRLHALTLVAALVALPGLAAPNAGNPSPEAKPAPSAAKQEAPANAPIQEWKNEGAAPRYETIAKPPPDPVFVQLGRDGRFYRILTPAPTASGITLGIAPGATVQMWDRKAFIAQPNNPFATEARWEAFPQIVVGPIIVAPEAPIPTEGTPAWASASGLYSAYPEGEIPVTVHVRNTGIGAWVRPRVRLFAPDNWTVTPDVAEVVSPSRTEPSETAPSISTGPHGVLPPLTTGTATFTVKIPKRATLGMAYPLGAFLRFEAGGQTVTVPNNVDVVVKEPIVRRYAMNEAGTKFIVHLENPFAPAPLGTPTVEVRPPAGTDWKVTPPAPVSVRENAEAVAGITMRPPGVAQIGVPVVVTLNGYRMGYTPVVYTAAQWGGTGPDGKPVSNEQGLRLVREGSSPVEITPDGACLSSTNETERRLALDVADKFAVSDPTESVSPTWVTITFVNRGARTFRLEHDAYGSDAPTVAAEQPVSLTDAPQTLSFLLPDARFAGHLPGKADLRLVFSGGDACIQRVIVSKWNPLKAAQGQ